MGIRDNSLQLGLAVLAGFAGSMLANHAWVSEPAVAKTAQAQVVTASVIEIVDEAGKARMRIGLVGEEKAPAVLFLDPQSGEVLSGLGLETDQRGVLLLRGPGGKTMVELRASDSEAALTLSGAGEQARVRLAATDQGKTILQMSHRERKQELLLELDKERAAMVAMQDGEKAGIGFVVGPEVDPALIVLKDDVPRVILGSTDVLLKNPDKIAFKERRGPASLVFLDEKGRSRWQAP